MNYPLVQFYADEISGWEKAISYLNEGVDEYLSKIALIMKTCTDRTKSNQLNDQITIMLTYVNDFDELKMRIFSQRQRLDSSTDGQTDPGPDLKRQQEMLRNRIYTLHSTYCRAEYTCTTLLFNCLKS